MSTPLQAGIQRCPTGPRPREHLVDHADALDVLLDAPASPAIGVWTLCEGASESSSGDIPTEGSKMQRVDSAISARPDDQHCLSPR
jgi:hypothetical protein